MDTENIEEVDTIKPKKRYYYKRTPAQIEAFKKCNEIKKNNYLKRQEIKTQIEADKKADIRNLIVQKAIEIKKKRTKAEAIYQFIHQNINLFNTITTYYI